MALGQFTYLDAFPSSSSEVISIYILLLQKSQGNLFGSPLRDVTVFEALLFILEPSSEFILSTLNIRILFCIENSAKSRGWGWEGRVAAVRSLKESL